MSMESPFDSLAELDELALRAWPLPMPADDGDKEDRGRALLIAGSPEIPGAAIIAARAAFRAGAGKVTVAAGESIVPLIAQAVPETRVIALPETPAGGIALPAADKLAPLLSHHGAVLIGPGMQDDAATCALVMALLPKLAEASLILDASAMNVVRRQLQAVDAHSGVQQRFIPSFSSPVLLTPHAGEMAHLTATDKESVTGNALDCARQAARRWNAMVALKGVPTYIAAPDGRTWRFEGGNAGLAMSGSGDVLAGIILGLAARGAPLEQACAWGVALHARAGERLAGKVGKIGYMAGELVDEVPGLMQELLG
ncbi:NAD(P)H-hydrate dehydratase [Noviherbaspirillum galbum]|uniref:ADP-dependent (S)-NAD(P)H-hydrate dehydratase n=1 Tax=Noviherbaspirillum galbum TaxID=2709383 RepID=A0A6B3SSN2_9BURK|nr:NAD(P)H-hydrate dehydratase [Noviherbaspirillum galbum]NEX63773.1 NAD(P)H-hydrate dehydratase [Noviherbaspirillum galbum]